MGSLVGALDWIARVIDESPSGASASTRQLDAEADAARRAKEGKAEGGKPEDDPGTPTDKPDTDKPDEEREHVDISGGVPDNVVRTVIENCRTLKFTSHGFEKE